MAEPKLPEMDSNNLGLPLQNFELQVFLAVSTGEPDGLEVGTKVAPRRLGVRYVMLCH
jgi:hypothetical protein